MTTSAKYCVGIDLGTTHCAMAVVELDQEGAHPKAQSIPQLVSQGTVEERPLLASCLYLPPEAEGAQPLPWDHERGFAVGEHARRRGVEAPARVITSAKSWLSHPGIDRRAGNLPLGAPDDVEKISPVETSWRFLEHLSDAFKQETGEALEEQEVVLTVPASFDAAARDLTVEAALAAGIEKLTLLEEPQAALYAWLDASGDDWRKELQVGDVILVIDIGGGTTDFSAIEVRDRDGTLELSRIAVGDHILLGGDNMDLALAHVVKQKLAADGKDIDRWQMAALTHSTRAAKEKLLCEPDAKAAPVVVPSRGSQLLGGSLRGELTREEVEKTLVEGFFPVVAADARPVTRARVGLTQLGLPYASDAAVTKHLSAFLGRQVGATAHDASKAEKKSAADRGHKLLQPTAVLFNGGVTKSDALRGRLLEVLEAWMASDGGAEPRMLGGADLELAVARGAAYYGLARRGKGLRIRGGTARAYYVGIEGAVPAVPGIEPPITALCVAPFGMEEGTEASLPPQEFGVVVGEPVRFHFYGSTVRRKDGAGEQLESWSDEELEELPAIEITLPAEGRREGDVVPVRLAASITEVGTLLLEAVPINALAADERWRVELNVRSD